MKGLASHYHVKNMNVEMKTFIGDLYHTPFNLLLPFLVITSVRTSFLALFVDQDRVADCRPPINSKADISE